MIRISWKNIHPWICQTFWLLDSHKAWKELKFGESAPFMQFDTYTQIQFSFNQITLSLSNDNFMTFNHNHHFEGVIQLN